MENGTKMILIAVTVIVTCSLVGIIFFYTHISQNLGSKTGNEISEINQEIAEKAYNKYMGLEINGTDVVNCIKDYKDDVAIKVELSDSSSDTNIYTKNTNIPDIDSEFRPKPTDKFKCSLIRDDASIIVGLKFTKIN